MPRRSATGNVTKRCSCIRKWTCAHPWYVAYKAATKDARRAGERFRRNLDDLIGRHCENLREAQAEGRRAIVAWLDGRDPGSLQPTDRPTLARLIEEYERRPSASANGKEQVGPITSAEVKGRPFGLWYVEDINREALEAFQRSRPTVAGNRNLAYLRALFNWAVADGLLPSTPFRVAHVAVVKLARESARARRLQGDEGDRLIAAAGPHLRDLVVAALETGCRLGELLSLQWHQVRFSPRAELFLPAQKTKAKKDRRVPVSTALLPVLTARHHDPNGDPQPGDAYVFGDEVGRRVGDIKKAWQTAVLRAHGHTPLWLKVKGAHGKVGPILSPESQEAYRAADLHFHDLRREAGSRWMDAGVSLATIQRWLGHANISQTSTYLAASHGRDEDDMHAYESRIGRIGPVAHRGIFSGSNGPERTRSGDSLTKKLK